MNYEQFVQEMQNCIKKMLPEYECIERQEIFKNNGKKLVGFAMRKSGEDIAPIIYLEQFYERYLNGESIEELCSNMIALRNTSIVPSPDEYQCFLNFKEVEEKIVYRLINFEKNKELLKAVPHLPMMDFAIVFCVVVSVSDADYYSLMIRNEHMDLWKVSISQLYEKAREITPKMFPKVFRRLTDYINLSEYGDEFGCPFWVLTNSGGCYGATTLLYPDVFREIYEKLNSRYYMLPSSIHEFLILPEDFCDSAAYLKDMVANANDTVVDSRDYLSDSVYYFNGMNITKM